MKSSSTKTEFLMTLSGKNVWQETEETHQEETKKLYEMPQKTISWKMFENENKRMFLSLLQCLHGSFVKSQQKKIYKCEVLVFSKQFRNVHKKNLYPCLFLSCRLFVADPANLS